MSNLLIHKVKIILMLSISLCSTKILFAQVTYIFNDDSVEKAKYTGGRSVFSNQPYIIIPFFGLKERLPDGKYIVVDLNSKDSARKDLSKYILIEGQYKDSLRQGKFKHYQRKKIKSKWVNKLTDLYTYKNGLLNGYYFSSNSLYKYVEGYYKNGNLNGFFIKYDGKGHIKKISLYFEDTLKYRVVYKNGKMHPLEKINKVYQPFIPAKGSNLIQRVVPKNSEETPKKTR